MQKGYFLATLSSKTFCLFTPSGVFRHHQTMGLSPHEVTDWTSLQKQLSGVLKTMSVSPPWLLPDLLKVPARAARPLPSPTCQPQGCYAAQNNFILTTATQKVSPSFEDRSYVPGCIACARIKFHWGFEDFARLPPLIKATYCYCLNSKSTEFTISLFHNSGSLEMTLFTT